MGKFEYTRESFAFALAVLVIGSFVYFFWFALSSNPTDINMAKEVTALFGGYVAAVLVYYFGQKQAQSLITQTVKAEKERDTAKDNIESVRTNFFELLEQRETIKKAINDTEERLKRLEGVS